VILPRPLAWGEKYTIMIVTAGRRGGERRQRNYYRLRARTRYPNKTEYVLGEIPTRPDDPRSPRFEGQASAAWVPSCIRAVSQLDRQNRSRENRGACLAPSGSASRRSLCVTSLRLLSRLLPQPRGRTSAAQRTSLSDLVPSPSLPPRRVDSARVGPVDHMSADLGETLFPCRMLNSTPGPARPLNPCSRPEPASPPLR